MSNPTLSIVIPVYNGEKFVAEALQSVLAETDIDMEVVVGDHSSTDGTRAIVAEFESDPRVKVITTPAGGYVTRSWRNVSEHATGKYLKLVCADDIVLPGVLKRQVDILEAHPEVVLTACPRDVTDAEGKVLIAGMGLQGAKRPLSGTEAVRTAVRAGRNIFGEPGCVTMRRDALEHAGGWFGEFPYVIDLGTYCRVLLEGDFYPDLTVGATFRLNADQGSVAQSKTQATQVQSFHNWMHEHAPEVVRSSDLRVGNFKAAVNAQLRKVTFAVLKRRMK